MSLRLGPPYVIETRTKLVSPKWHRLPSTVWLAANFLSTGMVALILITDGPAPWLLVAVLAFASGVGSLLASIRDAQRWSRPIAPAINVAASLLVNPYTVTGLLVRLGVVSFS